MVTVVNDEGDGAKGIVLVYNRCIHIYTLKRNLHGIYLCFGAVGDRDNTRAAVVRGLNDRDGGIRAYRPCRNVGIARKTRKGNDIIIGVG